MYNNTPKIEPIPEERLASFRQAIRDNYDRLSDLANESTVAYSHLARLPVGGEDYCR